MSNTSQEKRTATAILLSIIVILIYNQVIAPKPQPNPAPPAKTQSTGQATQKTQSIQSPPPAAITQGNNQGSSIATPSQTTTNTPSRSDYEQSEHFTVEHDLYVATFSTLGGRLLSFQLKEYKAERTSAAPLELVHVADAVFPLGVYVAGTNDAGVQYRIPEGGVTAGAALNGSTYTAPTTGNLSIKLLGTLPNGTSIEKTISFQKNKYLLDVAIRLGTAAGDGSNLWLEWTDSFDPEAASLKYNPKEFVLLEEDSDITRIAPTGLEGNSAEHATRWVAFGGNYFTAVLLNSENGVNTSIGSFGNTFFFRGRGDSVKGTFSLYLGPKHRELLRAYGHDLHRTVDLGWFAFVGDPILHGLHFLYSLLGNYGLAIVALTLLLKTALLPLTKTSFRSMKAMQDLQPEIKALRERVKDPTQLNKEVMSLYQKRGVNPLGGCFPMLLQMPIFLGMYNALQRDIDLRHAPFALWINDLSTPEGLRIFGVAVPVMILLMGASMLFQQITSPAVGDPAQRKAMFAVPVVFTIMFVLFPFPSGLVLYWLTNNVISIIQQMALRSEKGANPLKATLIGSVVVFVVAVVLTLL